MGQTTSGYEVITMEERGVKERVNNSQVYIWEDATQYAVYPTASGYTDSQVGDFVELNTSGELVRSPSGGSGIGAGRYWGLIVGIAPNSGEYPAFGAHFNQPLVAVLAPNKTELIVRQINASGNYIAPTLKAGDTTMFVYNSTTKRWGVQANGTNPATGRVVEVLNDGRLLIVFGG
jgi:hypothetical protein